MITCYFLLQKRIWLQGVNENTAGLSFATRKELAKWLLVTGFVPLAIEILLIMFVTVILVGAMAFGI